MRTCLALLALCIGVVPVRADDAKKEQDKLQGTWMVVSAEKDGQANDQIKDDKLVIQGDKMTVHKGKGGADMPVTSSSTRRRNPSRST